MEGVGSRLGRSSTRYGAGPSPAVFSGPVRKWKKRWVHIPPPPSSKKTQKPNFKGNIVSNTLSLYKWTKTSLDDDIEAAIEEPPRRKFRYIPIAKLEEHKNEAEENETPGKFGDQSEPSFNKPDINNVPMYENQGRGGKAARHDLNEDTFDLSLG